MFNTRISNTAFTTEAANAFFGDKIFGAPYDGDLSLLSTLRALLFRRMGKDDSLYTSIVSWAMSSQRQANYSNEQLLNSVRSRFTPESNEFRVCSFNSDDRAGNDKLYELTNDHFATPDNGWVKLDAITQFCKKKFDVLCFINEQKKSTVFVLKELTLRKLHYIQVAALTAMPWYFNVTGGDKVNEKEVALLNAICADTPDGYIHALEDIAAEFDFETEFVRGSLSKIETAYERERVNAVRQEIEELMRKIGEYQGYINTYLRSMNDRNIELLGLETKIANGDGESVLSEYFICNKHLKLDQVSGTEIYFHVNDYLTYYDEDMAQNFIDSARSVIYNSIAADRREDAKRLATAVFIDGEIKIRMCAAYMLDIRGGFDGCSGYNFRGDDSSRIPNTHINNYSCLGSYQSTINERMKARDFIGALEQMMASAKSLNFADGVVISRFFRDLYNGVGGKCFELEDGTTMNLEEVFAYLKEREEKEKDE